MFASVFLATLATCFTLVRGDPTPTTPSPGAIYDEGSNCDIAWTADTSGVWKVMDIDLMTGNNLQMQFLKTVATVDGTDPNNASFSYPCPDVNPNSAIYFYQFTSPYSKQPYWTGRFAIATSNGDVTPPTESTEYNGQNVSWGTGALVGQADSGSAPVYGESASAGATSTSSVPSLPTSSSASSSTDPSSSSSDPSGSSVSSGPGSSEVGPPLASSSTPLDGPAPSGMSSVLNPGSSTGSVGAGSPTPSSGAGAAANAAPGALKANAHILHAAVALSVAALTFVAAF